MLSVQRDKDSPYPKGLAGWIALDYFRRLRPLRGARKWVTLGAALVSALYAGWTVLPGRQTAHQAAPVATAHAMFNADCAQCHRESFQPLARLVHGDQVRSVSDQACLHCHDGAIHHPEQGTAPACAGCHQEHRGKTSLARVGDGFCTSCHARLKEKHPATTYLDVSAFERDHPEFRAVRPGEKDKAQLHFNHAAHLRLDLAVLRAKGGHGLDGFGARLECVSCHQPDAERRYMQPIRYEQHCARCHPLTVQITGDLQDPDARTAAEAFRKEPAPHREPRVVRAVLRERLLEFVQQHPVILAGPSAPPRPLPGRGPRPVSEAEGRWVKGQLDEAQRLLFVNRQLPDAERGLFAGSCRQCHVETQGTEGIPAYAPTGVPKRWFTHSSFRHDSHRLLDCQSCHMGRPRARRPATFCCRRCARASNATSRRAGRAPTAWSATRTTTVRASAA